MKYIYIDLMKNNISDVKKNKIKMKRKEVNKVG